MERRTEKSNLPRPKSDVIDRRITPLVAIDLKNEDGEAEQVEIDEVDEELLKEVDKHEGERPSFSVWIPYSAQRLSFSV